MLVLLASSTLLQAVELNTIGVLPNTPSYGTVEVTKSVSFISNFQGEPNWRRPPKNITGKLLSEQGRVTALVVLAENFPATDTDNNKYCRKPFAKGTFQGEIVVCQQSEIASNVLAENLKEAGASGMIIQAMSLEIIDDTIVDSIPSVSANLDAYFLLKNWVNYSKPGTAIATIGE